MTAVRVAVLWLCVLVTTPAGADACAGLVFEDAWIREPPPGTKVAAAYFRVRNPGSADVRIGEITSSCCAHVMMHETVRRGDRVHMSHLDGIPVPAGASSVFEPGGNHVMLSAPTTALREGDVVHMDFHCDSGRPVGVEFAVRASR